MPAMQRPKRPRRDCAPLAKTPYPTWFIARKLSKRAKTLLLADLMYGASNRRIKTQETVEKCVAQALDAAQGHPASLRVIITLYNRKKGNLMKVLLDHDVVGVSIYTLWADVCDRQDDQLITLLENIRDAADPYQVKRSFKIKNERDERDEGDEGDAVYPCLLTKSRKDKSVLEHVYEYAAADDPDAVHVLKCLHQEKRGDLIRLLLKHDLFGRSMYVLWSEVCGFNVDKLHTVLHAFDKTDKPHLVMATNPPTPYPELRTCPVLHYVCSRTNFQSRIDILCRGFNDPTITDDVRELVR